MHQDKNLSAVFKENALMFTSEEKIYHNVDMTGSTDRGDLSEIMPSIQPTMGGFSGALQLKSWLHLTVRRAYVAYSE